MKLQKCFSCNKLAYTPFHVTEIDKEEVHSFDMCKKCAVEYMKDFDPSQKTEPKQSTDLSCIKTPEELLSFITGIQPKKKSIEFESCQCGMTVKEFEEFGKLGCSHCYNHFGNIVMPLIAGYHKADAHVGKRPKRLIKDRMENDPVEKMKLLKLRYAQAIELEKYEEASVINEEINALVQSQSLSSTSEGL